jgi:hypothetical protein
MLAIFAASFNIILDQLTQYASIGNRPTKPSSSLHRLFDFWTFRLKGPAVSNSNRTASQGIERALGLKLDRGERKPLKLPCCRHTIQHHVGIDVANAAVG